MLPSFLILLRILFLWKKVKSFHYNISASGNFISLFFCKNNNSETFILLSTVIFMLQFLHNILFLKIL